jgi:hypothetical protein
VFRRTEKQPAATVHPEKVDGKNRPTPTRREAEAAAKQRARQGMDKKEAQKVLKERRAEGNRKVREGMRNGDPRYLMDRDKGPVRTFVRDYVDVRLSVMEYLLPVLVVIMVTQFSGGKLAVISQKLYGVTVVVIVVEVAWLLSRLGRELKLRFPDENKRGWRFYALMRAIQIRQLRMPKPRLKMRASLPTRY